MTPETLSRLNRKPEGQPPEAYQPLEGPEFAHWTALQPCEERWALIKSYLPLGTVALDLGCHTGWFSRRLTDYYETVIGVDRDGFWLDVARNQLGRALYLEVELAHWDPPVADVALCLSVLMYLFPVPGWKFLERLSERVPVLFVDFGGFAAVRLPFTEETFPVELQKHTLYKDVRLLGRTALDRPLFRCAR